MPKERIEETPGQRADRMKDNARKQDEANSAADAAVDRAIQRSIDKHGA